MDPLAPLRSPPTRPCLMFTIRHGPSSIAAAASAAERIDSSRQSGVGSRAGASRAPPGHRDEAAARPSAGRRHRALGTLDVLERVRGVRIDRERGCPGSPPARRATRSTSRPGSIFSLIRRYPSARYPSTCSRSSSVLGGMPTETPQATRSRVGAEVRREGLAAARSSASRTAFDSVALAIGLPRTKREHAVELLRPRVAGPEERRREEVPQHQPRSLVELLRVPGSGPATHSPHPSASSRLDADEDASFSVSSPNARPEGANEGKRDQAELDRSNDGHADPPVAVGAGREDIPGARRGRGSRPTTIMPRSKHVREPRPPRLAIRARAPDPAP